MMHSLLLSVMLCCVAVSVASARSQGCMFDSLMRESGPLPVALVRELPSKGQDTITAYSASAGSSKAPIRIVISKEDLTKEGRYCKNTDDDFVLVLPLEANGVPDFRGNQVSCNPEDALTDEKRATLTNEILSQAIQLHAERLLVSPIQGSLIMPSFTTNNNICRHFTVPDNHRSGGVTNADVVLYIASVPVQDDFDAVAWAVPCAVNSGDKRPVAGAMNFIPSKITLSRHTVRSAAHEIAHVLGFGYAEVKALNMVEEMDVKRKKRKVQVVKSEKVKKAVQDHFKCETVTGMELEDENGEANQQPSSHWERRNAKDELMTSFAGDTTASIIGYYTALTLSAFASMGFYDVKMEMGEHMEWGFQAGCDFLDKKCVDGGKTNYPKMFCTDETQSEKMCTSDRLGLGTCSLSTTLTADLAEDFKYFDSLKKGGHGYMKTDQCPIVAQKTLCSASQESNGFFGSLLGQNSWCLDGDSLKTVDDNNAEVTVLGVCVEVLCEDGEVKIKYKGGNGHHLCSENQSIDVLPNSVLKSGKIKCPKYEEVCTLGTTGQSLVATKPKKAVPKVKEPPPPPPPLPAPPLQATGSDPPLPKQVPSLSVPKSEPLPVVPAPKSEPAKEKVSPPQALNPTPTVQGNSSGPAQGIPAPGAVAQPPPSLPSQTPSSSPSGEKSGASPVVKKPEKLPPTSQTPPGQDTRTKGAQSQTNISPPPPKPKPSVPKTESKPPAAQKEPSVAQTSNSAVGGGSENKEENTVHVVTDGNVTKPHAPPRDASAKTATSTAILLLSLSVVHLLLSMLTGGTTLW